MRLVTANMDKERGGDRAYRGFLVGLVGRGLLLMQEVGRGTGSVRIRRVGIHRIRRLPLWVVGRVGVHRAIARAWVRVDGRWVRVFNVHGLHRRTVGRRVHTAHLDRLAARTRRLTRRRVRWIVGGDFNEDIRAAATRLGGEPHGVGVIGFVTSPGLRVLDEGASRWGQNKGYTDHPAYWIDCATMKEYR